MRNDKKKTSDQDKTPVADGDTRPDMQSDGSQKLDLKREKKGKDFSSNRAADVNSLEDFKDKKPE